MTVKLAKKTTQSGQNGASRDEMSRDACKGRILVIDDDEGMKSLIFDLLTSLGYSVEAFSEASGALAELALHGKDVQAVVCDLNMPRITGLDVLTIMNSMGCKVPVILVTAFATPRSATEAKKKGAFAYLSKPFKFSEIRELVENALARRPQEA
jgi:DNA-binding NtrC family response regulator